MQVVVPKLALQGPTDQRSISLRVDPVAPDQQPTFGRIDGNLYRLTLSGGGQPVVFRPEQPPGAI
ncbi:MAG: hypothetical protein QOK42_2053, partial [Frankiaceae bacterium]|nr:hypothetical protein [Frankiaceae bacterium]